MNYLFLILVIFFCIFAYFFLKLFFKERKAFHEQFEENKFPVKMEVAVRLYKSPLFVYTYLLGFVAALIFPFILKRSIALPDNIFPLLINISGFIPLLAILFFGKRTTRFEEKHIRIISSFLFWKGYGVYNWNEIMKHFIRIEYVEKYKAVIIFTSLPPWGAEDNISFINILIHRYNPNIIILTNNKAEADRVIDLVQEIKGKYLLSSQSVI